jgi:signal transduction histidine kinase
MKLLLRATMFYLLITLIVFGAGGIITYNIFLDAIQKETDRYLVERFREIHYRFNETDNLNGINDSKIVIKATNSVPVVQEPWERFSFSDTLVWHNGLRRMENNRKLIGYLENEQNKYKIEIHDVIVESDDIYQGVFQSQTRLFIILGIVMVISSFLISKWMFRPFNHTLEKIKNFNIKSLTPTTLGKTKIREFNILNDFINQMTEKVSQDYRNLKEFTENAAHELQTPLAIVTGKLELLLQQENLTKDQVELIRSSYESINHMSKLNKSLTLLSKIENKEFSNDENINLSDEVNKSVDSFYELIELKNISLTKDIKKDVSLKNDFTLIRILLNNLLQNAVRHNHEGGTIKIELTPDRLVIENTGDELKVPVDQLFERFKKGHHSEKNTGLGLSIVKMICELSGYAVTYSNKKNWHVITIRF